MATDQGFASDENIYVTDPRFVIDGGLTATF